MARRYLFAWRHAIASDEGPKRAPDRHIALTLSLYMNGDGLSAWPSQETLALRTGLNIRTVRFALARLCDEKWLSREPRKSPRGIKSKRWGYEYRAKLPTKLGNAFANAERQSLFNGKDPSKEQPGSSSPAVPKKNGDSHDQRIGTDDPPNTSRELVKPAACKTSAALREQEIADLEAFMEKPPI